MRAEDLIDYLFKQSGELHPEWTSEQHKMWALGFLATIAVDKYHMDSIVWDHVRWRIKELHTPTTKEKTILVKTPQRIQ